MSAETVEALDKVKRARQEVNDVASGRRRWTMCVPVQPDDTDVLLADALDAAAAIIAQTRALTTALERVLAYAPETYYRDATKVWCKVCDSPAADSPETMPHTDDCPVPVVRAALTSAPGAPRVTPGGAVSDERKTLSNFPTPSSLPWVLT